MSLEHSFCARTLEDAQLALAQAVYVIGGSLPLEDCGVD